MTERYSDHDKGCAVYIGSEECTHGCDTGSPHDCREAVARGLDDFAAELREHGFYHQANMAEATASRVRKEGPNP